MSDDINVQDRRLFNKDGEVNENAAPKSEPEKAPEKTAEKAPDQVKDKAEETLDVGSMPVSLAALFLDLATHAFTQMGEKGPDGKVPEGAPNLPVAKHLIDLLGLLELKTRGNLDPEEEALLKALLYDVRLKYVSLTSGKK
ncbi:MAG: DUF1844 domain-containing protein [Deltaproteobacteria bacterium]|jgi:hypothetical protein|nr:DUF1844 domain-containing protein [Deltaproteobacteria bacterium]